MALLRPTTDATPWWAVMTGAREENKADENLRRAGFWTFLPLVRVTRWKPLPRRLHGGKRIKVDRPLMPRYLFAQFERECIGEVNETPGVATVVHLGLDYTPIPGNVMERLYELVDDAGYTRQEDWTKLSRIFDGKVGDEVAFASDSPFFGIAARIVSLRSLDTKGLIEVDMGLIGGTSRTFVSLDQLARKVA